MGTDDSPCDENTSSQSFLGAGVPALSDVIALQQYEFEQSLANQQLWSQQLALEQEAKIKAAAEQVQKQVSDLTKVLKGGDNATPNVEALESFHARHVHDLRPHSKSLPDLPKSECELACPDKLKKEKKENEVSLPKFKDHHRSTPLSSERYRKESCREEKDRDRRSRSRDKIRGRGRNTIRSRSRDKIRSRSRDTMRNRSRDTIRSRSRDKIRGRIRDTIRNRSRDRRGRRRSRSWSGSRDRRRSRSRSRSRDRRRSWSRGRAVDRHRERSRSGSKSRGAALDGQHREKTSERSRKVQTHNEDDTLRSSTSHVSKSHIPSRISSKDHSSAYHLKDNNVTNTIAFREETGTEEQKGKDGKPIKNNKPIGEIPPNGFLMKESPGGYNYNKPVSSKSAPISSNYQTAACDGRSLEIVKDSTDLNVDSTTPAPLDLPNPIDHPLIITEEGEIVQGTGILELNMEPLGATDTC